MKDRGIEPMEELVRDFDWSKTPLGPQASWPLSLRTIVRLCLASRFPMLVVWGPAQIQVYNDAFRPILGVTKHPSALGASAEQTWTEIWTAIGPMFASVLGGASQSGDDALFLLERSGYVEETYFNFSYDPVCGDDGKIAGICVTCMETTGRVLGERRLRTLRDVAALGAQASSEASASELIARTLDANEADVPFAIVHLLDAPPRVACAVRAPTEDSSVIWRAAIDEVVRTRALSLQPVPPSFRPFALGAVPTPCEAVALPLERAGSDTLAGVLIVGKNTRRALDQPYRDFLTVLAQSVSTTLAGAHARQEIAARAEALAELDRAKTQFFSNVSHELRTPLTLILGPVEDALEESALLSSQDRERWELVKRSALRLYKHVTALLDFSRIEAGRANASFEPVDLGALTADLASMFRSAVERAGLAFVVDAGSERELAYVDREMWEKIVLNLLSNALKFTFDGEISIAVIGREDAFELVVRDTGVGISSEDQVRLFERFHRVHGVRARTQEGTGIGLALANELAKLHGGHITVASELGKGSRFTVTIPRGSSHLPPASIARETTAAEGTYRRASAFVEEALEWTRPPNTPESDPFAAAVSTETTSRILVADDNADMRGYIARLLCERWRVDTVADGSAAFDEIRKLPPDLVVADVMMPGLDGLALVRALRDDPHLSSLPVILLSARAGEEATAEGLRAGANDYLVKPFSARDLVVRVSAQLAIARAQRDVAFIAETSKVLAESLDYDVALEKLVETTVPWFADYCILDILDEHGRVVRGAFAGGDRDGPRLGDVLQKYPFVPDSRQPPAQAFRTHRPVVVRVDEEPYESLVRTDADLALLRRVRARTVISAPILRASQPIGVLTFIFTRPVDREQRTVELALELARRAATVLENARLYRVARADREDAERANRAKDDFIAMLSHELRNPLSAILGWTRLLRSGSVPDDKRARALETIERNAINQSQLIEDLLDVSRIISGKLRLSVEAVDVAQVVEAGADAVRLAMEAKRLRLESVVERDLPTVSGDPTRLQQVIANLLTNAMKFSDDGGVVRLEVRKQGDGVTVCVTDRGRGIDPAKLTAIFERFRQLDSSTTRATGLGLGLAICKAIVELHGGTIEAHSEGPGSGASFRVWLPSAFTHARSTRPTVTPDSLAQARRELEGVHVLVVDDDEDSAELVTMILERCGAVVATASSVAGAFSKIRDLPPDIILTDIAMPDADGYTFISQLRAMPRDRGGGIPAASLTGYASAEDRRRALEAGFDTHLTKPVDVAELVTVMCNLARIGRSIRATG